MNWNKVLEVGKPKKEGFYLCKFFNPENKNLPEYGIFYYRLPKEDNENFEGFYFNPTCNPAQNIEKDIYNYKVFEWLFLKNLLSKDGEYPPVEF